MKAKFITVKGPGSLAAEPFYLGIPQHERTMSKREAYEYLVNSVLRFLPVADFVALAERNGFELVHVKPCFFGVAYRVLLRRRT